MFFRNNETDFSKWYRHYVRRAKVIIRYHDNINDINFHIRNKDLYNEAKEIIKQYEVLKCSLTVEQNELLEKCLNKNEYTDYNYKNFKNYDEVKVIDQKYAFLSVNQNSKLLIRRKLELQ